MTMECPYCYKELDFDAACAGQQIECPFCGKSLIVEQPRSNCEQEPERANRREYKVLTQRDKALSLCSTGGRIDPMQLEDAMNQHARHGWRFVGCTNTTSFSDRNEIVVIMER